MLLLWTCWILNWLLLLLILLLLVLLLLVLLLLLLLSLVRCKHTFSSICHLYLVLCLCISILTSSILTSLIYILLLYLSLITTHPLLYLFAPTISSLCGNYCFPFISSNDIFTSLLLVLILNPRQSLVMSNYRLSLWIPSFLFLRFCPQF